MLEGTDIEFTAQLPDENEYPAPLLARCELLECFSERDDTRTLLAKDRESDRLYVVKCHLASGPFYDRTEPESLRKLSEAPFPRFVAEYRNEYMRCVLREYVEGETLEELAKHTHFSEEDVIRTGIQLCDELKILHSLTPPVIHRDIKPDNLFYMSDGTVKISDFGIAAPIGTANEGDAIQGTIYYCAPEVLTGAPTSIANDIYSMGVVFYECLTGFLPFDGNSLEEVALKQLKKRFPEPSKLVPSIPKSIDKIIITACRKRPEERYPSAIKMHDAIVEAMSDRENFKERKGILSRIFGFK